MQAIKQQARQYSTWIFKAMRGLSDSKEQREAWRDFERDRMRLATIFHVIFISEALCYSGPKMPSVSSVDNFISEKGLTDVNVELVKQLLPWTVPLYFALQAIGILTLVASYWRLDISRCYFTLHMLTCMFVATVPKHYGEMHEVLAASNSSICYVLLSFDGVANAMIGSLFLAFVSFIVRPYIYNEDFTSESFEKYIIAAGMQLTCFALMHLLQKASGYKYAVEVTFRNDNEKILNGLDEGVFILE